MVESRLESLLAMQIRAMGWVDPERNYKAIRGRKLEFDFAWPVQRIAVEVQGGIWTKSGHSTGRGITRDCEKMCLAQVYGWVLLPVTAEHIKSGQAIEWIAQAMRLRS